MSIWHKNYTLEDINKRGVGTMVEYCGVVITEIGKDFLVATMPVDHRTKQPRGLLHGGANVMLAESVASLAGNLVVDPNLHFCVGLEINANHLRSARSGYVTATAKPLHLGRQTQVWDIKIEHEGKPSCISRMTLSVLSVRG
jgi:1,4-dihydroxy-2-naphthoyl-CoA hydrolase